MSQFGRQEIFAVLVWVRIHRALAAQDFNNSVQDLPEGNKLTESIRGTSQEVKAT